MNRLLLPNAEPAWSCSLPHSQKIGVRIPSGESLSSNGQDIHMGPHFSFGVRKQQNTV